MLSGPKYFWVTERRLQCKMGINTLSFYFSEPEQNGAIGGGYVQEEHCQRACRTNTARSTQCSACEGTARSQHNKVDFA